MITVQVRKTIRKHNLISRGDRIVIGVSGGPDSVTLLYILNSLKKEFNLTLHVAHFNHMLRPDSASDARFVSRIAEKLGLPFTVSSVNVRHLAKKGSLEEIARGARFKFLFSVAKKVKAKKIALGHNLDDQAETVLMRIIRGTGLYGLAGILPKRRFSDFEVIRPLIEIKRKAIERFLKKKKIKARIDSSNLEDVYLRNRIRNGLLPLLEKGYNKNIKEILANFAESSGYDYDYLLGLFRSRFNKRANKLNLLKLQKMHPAMRRLLFREAIAKITGNTRRITFQHIREMEDLTFNRPLNSIVDLPKGISVIKRRNYLTVYLR